MDNDRSAFAQTIIRRLQRYDCGPQRVAQMLDEVEGLNDAVLGFGAALNFEDEPSDFVALLLERARAQARRR